MGWTEQTRRSLGRYDRPWPHDCRPHIMNKCVARAFLADADPPTFSLSSSFFFFLSKTISTARHVRNTRVPGKEEPRTLKKEPQRWTTPGRPPRPLTSSFVAYLSPPQLPAPPKRDTKSWLEGSKGKHVIITGCRSIFSSQMLRHVMCFFSVPSMTMSHVSLSGSVLTAGSILFSSERFAEHAPFPRAIAHAPALLNLFFPCHYLSYE